MGIQSRGLWKGGAFNFYGEGSHPEFQKGLWASCPLPAIMCDPQLGTIFFDDFFEPVTTGDRWTIVEDGGDAGGTDGVSDAVCGIYTHYCDGDDNDEAYLATAGESWLMATGKPLWAEFKFTFTNSATTAGVFCMGIATGGGDADTMQDTEAGPFASYDGFFFFKQSAETAISFESSVAGAQVTNAAVVAVFASGTTYRLGVYYDGVTTITPYVDDVAGTPHTMATNTEEGNLFFGVKSNGAEEYIAMDYIKVVQMR